MKSELQLPEQLVSDGPEKQVEQFRASRRWLSENHTVKMVGALVPRLSLAGLLFCFGWIACNASYQVHRVPQLEAKVQELPQLQTKLKKETAGKVQAERQIRELVNIVVAQGLVQPTVPAPSIHPTPKPPVPQ